MKNSLVRLVQYGILAQRFGWKCWISRVELLPQSAMCGLENPKTWPSIQQQQAVSEFEFGFCFRIRFSVFGKKGDSNFGLKTSQQCNEKNQM
jgi:hypothetical protein